MQTPAHLPNTRNFLMEEVEGNLLLLKNAKQQHVSFWVRLEIPMSNCCFLGLIEAPYFVNLRTVCFQQSPYCLVCVRAGITLCSSIHSGGAILNPYIHCRTEDQYVGCTGDQAQ